jgi:hypothetical protein
MSLDYSLGRVIVHAAPAASRAAAPSLRDACGTLDPPAATSNAASTRQPGEEQAPGRADCRRGPVRHAVTSDHVGRETGRPTARVPHMCGSSSAEAVTSTTAAGQRDTGAESSAPLKGSHQLRPSHESPALGTGTGRHSGTGHRRRCICPGRGDVPPRAHGSCARIFGWGDAGARRTPLGHRTPATDPLR